MWGWMKVIGVYWIIKIVNIIIFFLDFEDIGLFFFVYISVLFGIEYLEMDMNDVKEIIILYVK